jgi:hypothetical protein
MIVGTSDGFDPIRVGWGRTGAGMAKFAIKIDFALEKTALRSTRGF